MLTDYLDLVASGNYESATYMWTDSSRARAERFGITYTGIPIRVDCTSPVIRNIDALRGHLSPAVKQSENLAGNSVVRLQFSNVVGGRLIDWHYYAQKIGPYYWLMYPQDFYARSWPVVESKYFRIHTHPQVRELLNQALLDESDLFIERMADSLKLDKAKLKEIAAKKIEYFFCDNEETVKAITDQTTKGLLDLASNDIISADFPHFHEVVHLLVNMKLGETPLVTLPLLREGIAVRYGGRWGKRSSALMDLGVYLYKEKLVELDSILTVNGFDAAAGADIAYPVAGVFTSFLLDRLGQPGFFVLYGSLSRSDNGLDTLNHLQVRHALTEALHFPEWTDLLTSFSAYADSVVNRVSVARAGSINDGKELFHHGRVVVTVDKDWLAFEFAADSGKDTTEGNLLFGKDQRLVNHRSHLFDQQYKDGVPFTGYRFGVRVDQNEAGLYDYATNELVAKYIWGISPSEDYFSQTDKKIRIRFKTALVGKILPSANDSYLLPQ